MAQIRTIPGMPVLPERKKVAAYCRVSRDTDRLMHSVAAQISYYSALIRDNPSWVYAGVYADEGITGTQTERRDQFRKLIADCDAGRVDIILTKSISRFARNTVDLLNTVRHLRDIGVEVRFEEQSIRTLSGDGELMLTILASFAQEESISISRNIVWAKRKMAEQGMMTNGSVPYGYRCADHTPVIIPKEAAVVQRIFREYIEGKPLKDISAGLCADGMYSPRGNAWNDRTLKAMISNRTYLGEMVLGKWYTKDPLKHNKVRNRGEQDRYLIEESHDAIIDENTFSLAQEERKRRRELSQFASPHMTLTEFSGKVICGCCGQPFHRRTQKLKGGGTSASWTCVKPGGKCPTPRISEEKLKKLAADILGLPTYCRQDFEEQVDHIVVTENDAITFYLRDGRTLTRQYTSFREARMQAEGITGAFADRIFCEKCGTAFRHHVVRYREGKYLYWTCGGRTACRGLLLKDEEVKHLAAKALGLPEFDETVFDAAIARVLVGDTWLTFLFKDGHQVTERRARKRRMRRNKPCPRR